MTQDTKSKQDRSAALVAAVALAGGYASLASKLGLNKATVHQWNRVPAERVLAVEAATGVPRQRLRPDIYPD